MKSTKLVLILLALVLCIGTASASTATYSTTTGTITVYDSAGKWQSYIPVLGLTDIVVYQGSYLYASTKSDIRKFDITKPSSPARLTPWISTPANSLAIKGYYLYAGGKDLRVYSLANPKSPRLVNTKTLKSPCKVDGLEIVGSKLYVSTTANGVQTFNI